ncbi:MAG: 5,10-methylenetetrahydrofolate reductase [Phycisphaerae bacterium]|nr:5,10-methylenetetrahydrofolate reductase [Phycisphaerae bacterium]
MHFRDVLKTQPITFSFEFFPPRTDEGAEGLLSRARQLRDLNPSFVSVTYGAGGSTRSTTRDLVVRLQRENGLNAAAHLTCIGHTRAELREILDAYRRQGIDNIVALRGDPPQGAKEFVPTPPDGLRYANELVELIRREFPGFGVAVGGYPEGHPETPSRLSDLENLKRKVDAGADLIITQLFFDNRDFYDFRDRCELVGIRTPIVAGIMPIMSWKGIMKMAALCGARIPAKLLGRLLKAGQDNDDAIARVGIDWATQQCRDLLDNQVRGIHFYTLNRSNATIEIYRRLGATDSHGLRELAST